MHAGDVMDQVVTELVAAIEAGAGTWEMPWRQMGSSGWPTNAVTANRYSGANALVLAVTAARHGYPSARWATYKQWSSIDAQVRKGETSTRGIYWHVPDADTITITDDDTGEPVTLQADTRPRWARAFAVFNAAQVDGYDDPSAPVELDELARDARAEGFFAAVPADVRWGTGHPAYLPGSDVVRMPAFDDFHTTGDAYATLAHELGHWSGHPSRLARTYGTRFGDHAYAAEELVAELSAAFTCTVIGLETVARCDHAAYLAHWCTMLRAQPATLWTVAAKAQAATDHLASHSATP